MAKLKKVIKEDVVEVVEKPIEFPTVSATGRFQAVPFGPHFVVYSPTGLRVSSAVSHREAMDIVRNQNTAAQL